jgi:hypothetical protein
VFEVLREAIDTLRPLLAELDLGSLSGLEAKELVEDFADLERLAAVGRTLAAGRVAETGGWVHADGVFRDAGRLGGVGDRDDGRCGTSLPRDRGAVGGAAGD